MSQYKNDVRNFFSRQFNTEKLSDNDDIFSSGYANSLFAMQLIAWIEKDFDVIVEDDDLQLTNFNSISAVAAFIQKKRSPASAET